MSIYMMLLTAVVVVVLVFSLGYTLAVTRTQKRIKGELDTAIPGRVQEGIYQRNPVFLTYIAFAALTLLLIIFVAIYW
jgi:ammonia channel protein AmtB